MANTLSQLIESLSILKRSKKELEAQVKTVDKDIELKEIEIMQALDADGVKMTKSNIGQVTISESVYPQATAEMWPQIHDYIRENNAFYLLEKRIAVLAYRELVSLGRQVPGILPFTKRKLTFKES